MADDSNIDEILKSIDALLKEGEVEEHGHGDRDKPKSDAANNDEHPAEPAAPPAEAAEAGDADAGEAVGDREAAAVEPAAGEPAAEAGNEDTGHSPPHFLLEASGESADEPGEQQPRRIVLSEAMLVESTPDLLAYSEQRADETEQGVSAEMTGEETAEETAAPEDAMSIDVDRLAVQISNEIVGRLQDKLPKLVAKVVRKQLAAQLEKVGRKTK